MSGRLTSTTIAHAMPRVPGVKFRIGRSTLLVLTLMVALLRASVCGRADGITTLYSFGAGTSAGNLIVNADGWGPNGVIYGSDGFLYGTTFSGGPNGTGVIFKLSTNGTMQTLHTFNGFGATSVNAGGAQPASNLLLAADGNYYGVTSIGGAHGNGTLFKITATGKFTTLYSFSGLNANGANLDGANPFGSLIQDSHGAFWGATLYGMRSGSGGIFRFIPGQPSIFTAIHSFGWVNQYGQNADGAQPATALVQASDGSFYGSTANGGISGNGTLFKIAQDGTFTLLHVFGFVDANDANSDGAVMTSPLVEGVDGDLYGAAPQGGAYANGTLFKITPDGVFTVLHTFSASTGLDNLEGETPDAPLLAAPGGRFYGGTTLGGSLGDGTLFQLNPNGDVGVLYDFGVRDANNHNLDGISPNGLTFGANGTVFGTAYTGSANGAGTIFRLGPAISSLSPASVAARKAFTLTINGGGFSQSDRVYWNGIRLRSTFVSSNQLTAQVPSGVNVTQSQYPATVTISVTTGSGLTVTSSLTVTQ